MRLDGLIAALALLAGCGGREDPNLPNAAESQGLNEAAEMLDTSPDSLIATEDLELGNGEDANVADTGDVLVTNDTAVNGQ